MCCLEEEETYLDNHFHGRNNEIYLCPKFNKGKEYLKFNYKAQHHNLSLSNALCAADLLYGLGPSNSKIKIMPNAIIPFVYFLRV